MNLVEKLLGRIAEERRLIVVIGDAMVDHWVHGKAVDCQDWCQKFVGDRQCATSGGAANVTNCISRWINVDTQLFCQSGDDLPHKWRFIEDNKIVFRWDYETVAEKSHYKYTKERALKAVEGSSAVLLSDYDKGFLTPEFIQRVVAVCRERGTPCVADCKREPKLYQGCVLKCNGDYLARFASDLLYSDGLVVTHGAQNPVIWDRGPPCGLGYDLSPVKCVNHVGAGDCFAAHLTLALAYGFSLQDAAALAHSAGRVYVQHPHNRAPHPSEVAAHMLQSL